MTIRSGHSVEECKKNVIPTTPALQSGPSINRNICSSTTAERRQVAEKHRWTHRRNQAPQRCIDRVPPVSMPYEGHTHEFLCIDHVASRYLTPYAATLGHLNRCTESDKGQSQHRVLPSACCFNRALGNKNLSHPYTPIIRLHGLLFQCTTLAKHVEDLF